MIDPEIERELANIRAQIAKDLGGFWSTINERDEARKEALKVALANNEKRLDTMNEFRAALTDQSAHMMSRSEADASGRRISERVEQNRVAVEAHLSEITKPKWTLMLTLVSICLVMVGGIWALVGLKVDSTVAPVAVLAQQTQLQVTSNSERLRLLDGASMTSTQSDASSQTDRGQLNDRVRVMESAFASGSAERRAQNAVITAKLVEIETQFCASDIVRNLMHADDARIVSLLWAETFKGQHIPTDNAYFPRVCNRPTTSSTE
jgi:hypothetical protein